MSYVFPTHKTALPLRRFTVVPRLPPSLERLRELAYNLYWAWTPAVRDLFVRIDSDLFTAVRGNPVELLARVKQARLEALAMDESFVSHLDHAHAMLTTYLAGKSWFGKRTTARIAYFSMEYGLHESLPIYSGGLGVLAGDHLKTASDLGLPLVGVGLAYAEGYFRQVLSHDGLQHERYPLNDWHRLPVQAVHDAAGARLVIDVAYPERIVKAQLWRVQVGRVPLFLLDANLEENRPEDRAITGPLYGGDQEFRVRQEIMLGIGGVHALEALGLTPTVCHMNEGHSAFLALERIARIMRDRGATFAVAKEAACAGNLFTTHTPVPAGNDAFDPELVSRYLEPYRAALGITEEELLALGRMQDEKSFSMPVLAIRTADRANAVSELHGRVSRRMWNGLWPDIPEHEVPIQSVTNGVHVPSWVSAETGALYTRYLGPRWAEATDDAELFARAREIPDAELWQVHEHRRHRLVTLARRWLAATNARQGDTDGMLEPLDPRALTIGFARRFATYKRATLLFQDLERLGKLLGDADRPVQLLFAGKAHPQDRGGKELIRSIVHASRNPNMRGRIVFIEDYDMRIARALVSGVDVWLNTPRRPHEASGTSGMKAAANGALNVSVLDGWWAEAWARHGDEIGWAIGDGAEPEERARHGHGHLAAEEELDRVEAEALYDVLEREVVPLFFDRDKASGLPRRWIRKMKASIARIVPEFNTVRMVKEYTERFYLPAIAEAGRLTAEDLSAAARLVAWKDRVHAGWKDVVIDELVTRSPDELSVGEPLKVEAKVRLGALVPDDVVVELYFGPTHGGHELLEGTIARMQVKGDAGPGAWLFAGEIPTSESGAHAFAARVMPWNPELCHPYETSLVRWA